MCASHSEKELLEILDEIRLELYQSRDLGDKVSEWRYEEEMKKVLRAISALKPKNKRS